MRLSFTITAPMARPGAKQLVQVAMTAQVPYAAYRAISDTLRGNGQEYALNADKAAAASARLLTEFLYDFKEVPYEL